MNKVSYKRHMAKTFTWRAIGTLDTVLLSWFITGSPFTGLKIGFSEVVTKMILYYLHERAWLNVRIIESHRRHLFKTVSWRFIGTLDTIVLSWVISGDAMVGLKIGGLEMFTKMILYYIHERVWYKVNFGVSDRKKKPDE